MHCIFFQCQIIHTFRTELVHVFNGVSIFAILRPVYAIQYSVSEGGVMATFTSEPHHMAFTQEGRTVEYSYAFDGGGDPVTWTWVLSTSDRVENVTGNVDFSDSTLAMISIGGDGTVVSIKLRLINIQRVWNEVTVKCVAHSNGMDFIQSELPFSG